jgi:phosphoribosylamine---glycine ligase
MRWKTWTTRKRFTTTLLYKNLENMKVLVIGGGGREHAMAWKLAQSPKVQRVYVAPGNGGTAADIRLQNIAIDDVVSLREWAMENKIGLTVVGPEVPLAAGVVDVFRV